jgi:phosphatidylglycerophosphate synthase
VTAVPSTAPADQPAERSAGQPIEPPGRPTAADFLARNRGGGLFSELVSQRIAAHLCVAANRFGLAPTVLTLGNLVVGLGTSFAVIALAGHMPGAHLAIGLAALVLWQFAYALDCGDGQLARVTGQTSPAGKRIDILCDVALQITLVAAVVQVASVFPHHPPSWVGALFAGTWMINLVTSVLQQDSSVAHSLVTSSSPIVRVVKLVRDYGAVVTVIGLVLAFVPQWTVWLMVAFIVVNGAFLLASIAVTARASLGRS